MVEHLFECRHRGPIGSDAGVHGLHAEVGEVVLRVRRRPLVRLDGREARGARELAKGGREQADAAVQVEVPRVGGQLAEGVAHDPIQHRGRGAMDLPEAAGVDTELPLPHELRHDLRLGARPATRTGVVRGTADRADAPVGRQHEVEAPWRSLPHRERDLGDLKQARDNINLILEAAHVGA